MTLCLGTSWEQGHQWTRLPLASSPSVQNNKQTNNNRDNTKKWFDIQWFKPVYRARLSYAYQNITVGVLLRYLSANRCIPASLDDF